MRNKFCCFCVSANDKKQKQKINMNEIRFLCHIQVLFHVLLKILHSAVIYARRRFMFSLSRHFELLMPFLCRKLFLLSRRVAEIFVSSFVVVRLTIDSASDSISIYFCKLFQNSPNDWLKFPCNWNWFWSVQTFEIFLELCKENFEAKHFPKRF